MSFSLNLRRLKPSHVMSFSLNLRRLKPSHVMSFSFNPRRLKPSHVMSYSLSLRRLKPRLVTYHTICTKHQHTECLYTIHTGLPALISTRTKAFKAIPTLHYLVLMALSGNLATFCQVLINLCSWFGLPGTIIWITPYTTTYRDI